jgi:hypothetical protein
MNLMVRRCPGGRALFGMLSVFSEFERSMIRDRLMAVPTWTQGEVIASLDAIRADLRAACKRAELADQG